jgi:uncharacterized protein YukE
MPAGVSAWTALANVTLASPANTVTFSSISGSYRDLRLVFSGGIGSDNASFTINNDSSSTYLWATLEGNGSAVSSAWNGNSYGSFANNYVTWYSSTGILLTMDLIDYSATDKHKTILSRLNNTARATNALINRWPSTAAITSIRINGNGANFTTGSTFALYGVSA